MSATTVSDALSFVCELSGILSIFAQDALHKYPRLHIRSSGPREPLGWRRHPLPASSMYDAHGIGTMQSSPPILRYFLNCDGLNCDLTGSNS